MFFRLCVWLFVFLWVVCCYMLLWAMLCSCLTELRAACCVRDVCLCWQLPLVCLCAPAFPCRLLTVSLWWYLFNSRCFFWDWGLGPFSPFVSMISGVVLVLDILPCLESFLFGKTIFSHLLCDVFLILFCVFVCKGMGNCYLILYCLVVV